jgi:hypothetical protein
MKFEDWFFKVVMVVVILGTIVLGGFLYHSCSEVDKSLDELTTSIKNSNLECKKACVNRKHTSGEAMFADRIICVCWNENSGEVTHFLLR